ncbi:MAG: acetylxylan esterase [Bacteroidota bacterium]
MRSFLFLLPFFPLALMSQIYDEAKVPEYELPALLTFENGESISHPAQWPLRRQELLHQLAHNVFGHVPTQTGASMSVEVLETGEKVLEGLAHRRQVRLTFAGNGQSLSVDVLLYVPAKAQGKVPVFLGYNFFGNQSIHPDPAILITQSWTMDREEMGVKNHQATGASRGVRVSRWPVEQILKAGYGLAVMYYGDIDPDVDDGFQNGIHPLFSASGQNKPAETEWGSIAAWAWGLSRALDYLETEEWVDGEKVIVIGHSRLGKTSLWAGATDERFAAVISNNSGCGGAALSRREFGETVRRINTRFPHWFNDRFVAYNENLAALPVDQHSLLAAIAPRPLYVASASEDLWADPMGEFLATQEASQVYEWLGRKGLTIDAFPEPNTPAIGRVSYHLRAGKHDLTAYDWEQYLKFADQWVK